jgi:hypothetical protein
MLKQFKTDDLSLSLLQSSWSSDLNPLIANPVNSVNVLKNISLKIGSNVINHKLGRNMQGWFITDIDGVATIYRSAPMNDLTLTLTSSAAVTIQLGVF